MLCEISDYVGEFEQLKALNNYGFAQYPLAMNGLGDWTAEQCAELFKDKTAGYNKFVETGCKNYNPDSNLFNSGPNAIQAPAGGVAPAGQFPPPPPGSFAANAQQTLQVFTPYITQFATVLAKNKKPKKNIVVEQQQDYTMYMVIGGGILVAAMLAMAVGKSSRRRD